MNELLFFSVLFGFGIIYILLAIIPSRQIKDKKDYFLAGRNLGRLKATVTLIATQLGAGLLLGTSQQAYHLGFYALIFTVGITLGLILLGCGIASRLRALNIVTTTEIFETKYNSPMLRRIASFIVTITLGGILIGNIVASKTLLLGLGIKNEIFFLTFWLFLIIYTMIGGLKAVVLTDVFQVLFIIAVFVPLFFYSIFKNPSFFDLANLKMMQQHFAQHPPSIIIMLRTLLMPALFALFEQDLAQVFFAARTKQVATFAAFATTAFILIFGIIPIYFGIQSQLIGISVAANASPLIPMIAHLTNDFIVILVAVGILAAIASTADALLCAISGNICQDLNLSFLGLSPVVESKTTIIASGLTILGLSYFMPPDIIKILVTSYGVPVSCLLVPLLFAYFKKEVSREAGICSVIAGVLGFVLFNLMPLPIPPELPTLALSLIGYAVGEHIL
ncbi:MAG: sodium:solute symporter family protein [Candidatus Babeliales bacterium]